MKNLKKIAVLGAVLALTGHVAQAQYTQASDDLILAFTSSTDTSDYTVDLGSLASITSPTTLSGNPALSLTTFNADFSSLSGVSVAAVGGKNTTGSGGKNVIMDALRVGGTANPLGAGTETMPGGQTANTVGQAESAIRSLTGSSTTEVKTLIGTGPGDTSVTGSAQQLLQTTSVGGLTDFSSGVVTMDIWEMLASSPSTWTFLGDLTVTDNGTSLSAEFTPQGFAVPEPATYGIIGAMGLLVLALRRQFSGVSA